MSHVLALDASGLPRKWINYESAVSYFTKGIVAWSLGDTIATFRGGWQKDGTRSIVHTPSIIAVKGKGFNIEKAGKVTLSNKTLFARDRHMCAYCGKVFTYNSLSRDHVQPVSRGGLNTWTNCVTSCVKCNTTKGSHTPEEIGRQLLYVPYEPNHYENMILQNRNILADQMEYLLCGVPKHSRVLM
jgi:predicted transcriptional regulator